MFEGPTDRLQFSSSLKHRKLLRVEWRVMEKLRAGAASNLRRSHSSNRIPSTKHQPSQPPLQKASVLRPAIQIISQLNPNDPQGPSLPCPGEGSPTTSGFTDDMDTLQIGKPQLESHRRVHRAQNQLCISQHCNADAEKDCNLPQKLAQEEPLYYDIASIIELMSQ